MRGLLGQVIGDSLGVPVEFQTRDYLRRHPVTAMTGYGTHNQPPGTWSDDAVESGGYVVHTLEASVWCVLTTRDFRSAVLKAVNLGGDTDTTGAVTGGLAGLYYGDEGIPREWLDTLARRKDIEDLARRFSEVVTG